MIVLKLYISNGKITGKSSLMNFSGTSSVVIASEDKEVDSTRSNAATPRKEKFKSDRYIRLE